MGGCAWHAIPGLHACCLWGWGAAKTGGYEDLDEFRALFFPIHTLSLLISNRLDDRKWVSVLP